MEQGFTDQNRRARRSHVYLAATLDCGGEEYAVKLRNLSSEGALVEAKSLPIEGSEVMFSRNELKTRGRVVWVNGSHAGIAFADQLQPQEVLRHVPAPRPKPRPDFRRPGLASVELSPEQKRLIDSWAVTAPVVLPNGE